jgi:hypothetical protein
MTRTAVSSTIKRERGVHSKSLALVQPKSKEQRLDKNKDEARQGERRKTTRTKRTDTDER